MWLSASGLRVLADSSCESCKGSFKKDSVKVSMRATVVLLSKGRCLIAWVGDAGG